MHASLDNLTNLTAEEALRMWARLRRESVFFSEPGDGSPGFWSVTRYEDVKAVLRDHETFGSADGFKLGMEPGSIHRARGKILIASDLPDHARFRKAFNPVFGPSAMAVLTEKVGQDVRETVDDALREKSFDFVEKIALRVPSQAICAILGAPKEDWKLVADLTNHAFTVSSTAAAAETYYELFLYCVGLVKAARRSNTETPLSKVVEASAGTITYQELVMNLHGIFQAATESTRYSIAGGFAALIERPEQWQALRRSPELIPGAVEEILRWTTPAMHTMRKVRADGMIGDTPVAAGDSLAVWLVSANFDETVFRDPEVFDITRSPNPHVAFADGRHLCIGARLSRLEISLLLQELVSRIDSIELAGEPRRVVTKQMQGLEYLPIRPKLRARLRTGCPGESCGAAACPASFRTCALSDDRN
jgi:cytochrome P450